MHVNFNKNPRTRASCRRPNSGSGGENRRTPELDDLFQFIFDSTTKRSHPIDCRNAVRTLAMVLNGCYRYELPLIQYSFLEEFLEDPDFAIKRTLHNMSEEDMLQRLKRSRKQIYARCKGFLDVLSPLKNARGPLCRREVAKFAHRSLAEFLQRKDIQEEMAPHLVGFDGFDFCCQALTAELKSTDHEDYYFTSMESRFGFDIQGRISAFTSLEPPNSARFYSFLDDIARIVSAQVLAERKGFVSFFLPGQWSCRITHAIIISITDYHPSMHIRFYAAQYGLYEYLLGSAADGAVEPRRHREHDETLGFALTVAHGFPSTYFSLDRFLKTLGYCFENGIAANSRGGHWGPVTYWQHIPFESEPLIRVFLLYGADPYFWLRFEPDHRSIEFRGAVRVAPQFGTARAEPFHAIYIDMHSGGILDFARENGWTLSLRDIVGYWFPKRAKVLQELIDRNTARQQADPTEDELKVLKARPDFDLDVQKGLGCEENEYFFTSFMGHHEWNKAMGLRSR
ncbi:MAG: hypothetical protein M1840_004991 [Geoglossum simile]|nr:MAG: hypothetical protein M1840_004991 [Geoglossum simile]